MVVFLLNFSQVFKVKKNFQIMPPPITFLVKKKKKNLCGNTPVAMNTLTPRS